MKDEEVWEGEKEPNNISELVKFIESNEAELIPAFLALIEMCFHCDKHSL
jgi:hypothetical protein